MSKNAIQNCTKEFAIRVHSSVACDGHMSCDGRTQVIMLLSCERELHHNS